MTLEVYIDGGIAPINPGGIASYGIIVREMYDWRDSPEIVFEDYGIIGNGKNMSNNVAEYGALVKFLEWFDKQSVEDVVIKSDSKLLINQMQGNWGFRMDALYYPFFKRALTLVIHNAEAWKGKLEFILIPREQNLADELATKAREEYLVKKLPYQDKDGLMVADEIDITPAF